MYIEMIDETGQVSEKLKEQTLELLDFAAQRLGKEDKEMAVTFVTNERSHELNLEYRDTDRPTDVISLEYKPELDISFDPGRRGCRCGRRQTRTCPPLPGTRRCRDRGSR